ncbi:MAG TPA: HisA/HisF-related TIM barrel protein [Candidatus Acidoferrales bacterium]|nr:HisA/HisF-related TIM barrel protein [Candidatus Acidoferrales bacterium]
MDLLARSILVVPAIDLRGGRCVRLLQGDPSKEKSYDADPVARAKAFVRAGATRLHVVDLDGALGSGENLAALRAICAATGVSVQTGGGVRRPADIEARFGAGATEVIIGTLLVEDPPGARMLIERYRERLIAGIDARGDRVATRGWQQQSHVSRDALVRDVASWGVERVIYTEIARDGMGSGYDLSALTHVAKLAPVRISASGGARTIDDLMALREGTPSTVDHAIVGRALYEGTIDLEEAITAVEG